MKDGISLEEFWQSEDGRRRRQQGQNSRNRKRGRRGEDAVARELKRRGLLMVEKLEVGWGIQRDKGGQVVEVWPLRKISGDYRAITPEGQSVLVEVKTADERLQWSKIRPHQRKALEIHANCGGLSLLAWVHDGQISIMWWPIEGFVKGTSLSAEQANQNEWEGFSR